MKQEVICLECLIEFRKLFPIDDPYPGEHIKVVNGAAKKDFVCDHCGSKIFFGCKCAAISIWANYGGIPYYAWESKHIKHPCKNETTSEEAKEI